MAALLAACSEVPAPEQAARVSYRNEAVTIASTLRFDLARFGGAWVVRAGFVQDGFEGMAVRPLAGESFVWIEGGAALAGEVTGPGRFRLEGREQEYWVLWVDEGFRTAAIGTPDGSFGYILDRMPSGGQDRYIAARELFDFNGYDVSKLLVRK